MVVLATVNDYFVVGSLFAVDFTVFVSCFWPLFCNFIGSVLSSCTNILLKEVRAMVALRK